jgi:hypothetical protein
LTAAIVTARVLAAPPREGMTQRLLSDAFAWDPLAGIRAFRDVRSAADGLDSAAEAKATGPFLDPAQ